MKATTQIALQWAIRCFGVNHVYDKAVRSLRLAEEAVELAQTCGVEREMMHKLIDTVYDRPRSKDTIQELGGVALTLEVMCGAILATDSDLPFTRELQRVLNKPPEHFTQRNQEKLDLGLTG